MHTAKNRLQQESLHFGQYKGKQWKSFILNLDTTQETSESLQLIHLYFHWPYCMEENMITEGLRKLVTLASQCALIRLQQDYHGSDLISNPTRGKIYEGFEEVQIKQPINSKSYLPRRCDRKDGVFCKSSSTHPKSQAIFQQADRQSLPFDRGGYIVTS